MPASRFARWQWYEQVEPFGSTYLDEPFGELRADYRAAQIVAMIHNSRVKKEDQKSADAFLLKFEKRETRKKQSVDEQLRNLRIWIAALSKSQG